MPSFEFEFDRRRFLTAVGGAAFVATTADLLNASPAAAQFLPTRPDFGAAATAFPLGQVQLAAGRWQDNMNRTLSYLRFIDVDRLLYNHRNNHGLSTQGAEQCYGWEAPTFEFRTHSQGHFLSGWAHAYVVTGEEIFKTKADYMVAELAKCQAAPTAFHTGYLSGFPESDFDTVETGQRKGVPYYCIHKTMAGLLDVWTLTENRQARNVLLALAGWVDWRTGRLTTAQMQTTMNIEFGGMNAVLTDLYQQTGDARWLTVAQRFDHAAIFDPLAADNDQLNGKHANTQIPKIVGAAREYKATGTTRYRDIATNFWDIVTAHHSYVIGGNSVGEFFKASDQIAKYLTDDTCESCNTYNMLKLTRELYLLDPENVALVDYYEAALMNQLLGQQDPNDPHGNVCYFTPLKPGGQRFYSKDYTTFTCCQGTGLETQTKLSDSVYFANGTTLYVNLFIGSTLDWQAKGITVTQTTTFPASDTTTLRVSYPRAGQRYWPMKIRIPGWTSGAVISINGTVQNVTATPGSYATLARTWTEGDTVTVKLPMKIALKSTPDNEFVQAVTYGPVVLSGAFGTTDLRSTLPVLDTKSITATDTPLKFTANAGKVTLIPFYDNHHQNYSVFWDADGKSGIGAPAANFHVVNVGSGLVLGVRDMSTADGGLAIQWGDTGTADHDWELVPDGNAIKFRNINSGKVLGVQNMSTADDATVLQWSDNGTQDHRWTITDLGDGTHKIVNVNSNKVLGVLNGSTAWGAQVVQAADDGSADNTWRLVPNGRRKIQNLNSTLLLGIENASAAAGAPALQWNDNGTDDHLWESVPDAGGAFKLRNVNSGKVLGLQNGFTANGTRAVQADDNGAADHLWRLRYGANGYFRIQNTASGRVLGILNASTSLGAYALQWDDTGTNDHLWRFA